MALFPQLMTKGRGAGTLPTECRRNRLAGRPIPAHHGFTLIADCQRSNAICPDGGNRPGDYLERGRHQQFGGLFYPAFVRSLDRQRLGEARHDVPLRVQRHRFRIGGALIEGNNNVLVHRHSGLLP